MDVRSVIPTVFVGDHKPIVHFDQIAGGSFDWDDDLPGIVTISLGAARSRFIEVGSPGGPVHLAYRCDDADVWLDHLNSQGVEALGASGSAGR